MTNTPHTPASAVPAEPVVQIEIFGDTVSVNGVVIVHDGSQSLHHVAVHAAAERVSRPLGRPVRAQAIDSEGRATLVVHPDGHATDVELVESYDSEADAVAAAAPTVAAPVVSSLDTTALPSVVPASFAPPTGPPPTSPPPGVAARPVSSAPNGWPSKIVRRVAVAVALVAVVGLGVLLLGNRSSDTDQARDDGADTTATPSPASASESADAEPSAAATTPAAEATSAAEAPVFSVVSLGGVNALRLTITTDTVPGTAEVVVTAPGKTVNRSITLEDSTYELDLGQIPAGTASWQVTVAGAAPQTGTVAVTGPYVAPTPTPTALPVVPTALPPVPTATVTKTAKPKKPKKTQEPPTTTKPSKPKKPGTFGEKKKNKFGDKGSSTKPSKPIDPDD